MIHWILLFLTLLSSCNSAEKIIVTDDLPEDRNCYSIGSALGKSVDNGYEGAIYEAKKEAATINGTHVVIMRKFIERLKDDSKTLRKVYVVSARVYECDD